MFELRFLRMKGKQCQKDLAGRCFKHTRLQMQSSRNENEKLGTSARGEILMQGF